MTTELNLIWQQCQGNVWCNLNAVDVSHAHFRNMNGVYMIWHGGSEARVVYVGSGDIGQRILEHRNDTRIQAFASLGLFVTWARVEASLQKGVEVYLASHWEPKVGERHPDVAHVAVNFPWR